MSVTYEMKKARIESLFSNLKDLSDLSYLEKIWIENSIPNIIDSWEERMCLIGSVYIKDLVTEEQKDFLFNPKHQEALLKFYNLWALYCKNTPNTMNPREALDSKEFKELSLCAKETLESLNDYEVPQ
jgi:hypothetical protein